VPQTLLHDEQTRLAPDELCGVNPPTDPPQTRLGGTVFAPPHASETPPPPPPMPRWAPPADHAGRSQEQGTAPSLAALGSRQPTAPLPPHPPPTVAQNAEELSWNSTAAARAQMKPPPPSSQSLQILTERDGCLYCLLCSQWADKMHLGSKKHMRRLETPEYYLWDEDTPTAESNNHHGNGSTGSTLSLEAVPPPPPPLEPPPLFAQAQHYSVVSSSSVGQRSCAWCSNVALDRAIPGTRARYCASCWEWWLSDGGGAGGGTLGPHLGTTFGTHLGGNLGACFGASEAPCNPSMGCQPAPPPVGVASGCIHTLPPDRVPTYCAPWHGPVPNGQPSPGGDLNASETLRWLDGEEICV